MKFDLRDTWFCHSAGKRMSCTEIKIIVDVLSSEKNGDVLHATDVVSSHMNKEKKVLKLNFNCIKAVTTCQCYAMFNC